MCGLFVCICLVLFAKNAQFCPWSNKMIHNINKQYLFLGDFLKNKQFYICSLCNTEKNIYLVLFVFICKVQQGQTLHEIISYISANKDSVFYYTCTCLVLFAPICNVNH